MSPIIGNDGEPFSVCVPPAFQQCAACLARWHDVRMVTPGACIGCDHCGHLMKQHHDGTLRDLTRGEAEIVRSHSNFPCIRRMQEEVHHKRRHWG